MLWFPDKTEPAFDSKRGAAAPSALQPDPPGRVRAPSTSRSKASGSLGHFPQAPAGADYPPAPAGTSREQKMAALAMANEIRFARGHWKRAVRRMEHRLALVEMLELLESHAWWIETWRIEGMLRALPKVGVPRSVRILKTCQISEGTTIAELTPVQRAALAAWLAERAEILAA